MQHVIIDETEVLCMVKLREKGLVTNILLLLVSITSIWGLLWSIFLYGFSTLEYFTNQSNLIVAMTVLLFFLAKDDKKWFTYLSAIALVDILMTGIIFHTVLDVSPITFQMHLTHTFTPILYFIFYFVSMEGFLKVKSFWIVLIHPLVYFLFFLVTGPFTGYYPYAFMDVATYGLASVLRFTLLILLPAIVVLSFILIYLKNKLEKSIKG